MRAAGKSVGVINVRTLKPIDEKIILKTVAQSKLIVTIEDHFITGGLYSIIAEILLNHRITTDVMPFALREKWFQPALLNDVMENEGFTGKQIAEKILGRTTEAEQPKIELTAFAE